MALKLSINQNGGRKIILAVPIFMKKTFLHFRGKHRSRFRGPVTPFRNRIFRTTFVVPQNGPFGQNPIVTCDACCPELPHPLQQDSGRLWNFTNARQHSQAHYNSKKKPIFSSELRNPSLYGIASTGLQVIFIYSILCSTPSLKHRSLAPMGQNLP